MSHPGNFPNQQPNQPNPQPGFPPPGQQPPAAQYAPAGAYGTPQRPLPPPSVGGPNFQPRQARQAREVGVPMAIIVIGFSVIGLLALLFASMSPQMFAIGAIPSTLALIIGLSCYMWLDQWEPEPPKLLMYAFVWGGGISVIGTLVISLVIASSGLVPPTDFYGAVIEAPIVEEAMKGSFLFFMLAGANRREMHTLVDHLVYAGFVGFGFAFVENLMYFATSPDMESTLFMTVVRTGFNLFGHALYTSATAVGIYLGRKYAGNKRALYYVGGYLVAVLLHALWNGAATWGGMIGLGVAYLVLLTPAFVALVMQGVKARKREGEVLRNQLPGMVQQGLISPDEANWIASLNSRSAMRKQLKGQDAQLARLSRLVDAVVELAIIRDRSMGEPSQFEQKEEAYLVQAIIDERNTQTPQAAAWVHQQAPQGPQF